MNDLAMFDEVFEEIRFTGTLSVETKEKIERFMSALNSISQDDMDKNGIRAIKLITEKTSPPRLIVSYSSKDKKIDGMDKIEQFIKKIKKIK